MDCWSPVHLVEPFGTHWLHRSKLRLAWWSLMRTSEGKARVGKCPLCWSCNLPAIATYATYYIKCCDSQTAVKWHFIWCCLCCILATLNNSHHVPLPSFPHTVAFLLDPKLFCTSWLYMTVFTLWSRRTTHLNYSQLLHSWCAWRLIAIHWPRPTPRCSKADDIWWPADDQLMTGWCLFPWGLDRAKAGLGAGGPLAKSGLSIWQRRTKVLSPQPRHAKTP